MSVALFRFTTVFLLSNLGRNRFQERLALANGCSCGHKNRTLDARRPHTERLDLLCVGGRGKNHRRAKGKGSVTDSDRNEAILRRSFGVAA